MTEAGVGNPVLSCILGRRSVRRFDGRMPDEQTQRVILEAAMRAPTAANMQLYSILDIRDAGCKKTLAETCNHQKWIADAPLLYIFCADYQRQYDYLAACGVEEKCAALGEPFLRPGEQSLLLASCDAMFAAQNAVLAAESLGLASCYVGHIMDHYETHAALRHLPRYVFPVMMLAMGYPIKRPEHQAPRFDSAFIVHRDEYHRADAQALLRCYERNPEPPEGNRFGAENAGQYWYLKRNLHADCYREGIRSLRAALKNWDEPLAEPEEKTDR